MVQWIPTNMIFNVDICIVFDKGPYDVNLPVARRQMQGRLSLSAPNVDIDPTLQEELHDVKMPIIRRCVKWCPPLVIPGRQGRTTLDEEAHDVEKPIPCCAIQGSLLLIGPAVNICTLLNQ